MAAYDVLVSFMLTEWKKCLYSDCITVHDI